MVGRTLVGCALDANPPVTSGGVTLGTSGTMGFATKVNYTLGMAKSAKSTPAMDKLVDSFSELVAEAKERMSDEELRQAEKKVDEIVSRVRVSRGRQRETA